MISLPDSAEYWWPVSNVKCMPKIKKNIPQHECKPRGGISGTKYRRFCAICNKPFKKGTLRNE